MAELSAMPGYASSAPDFRCPPPLEGLAGVKDNFMSQACCMELPTLNENR